MLSAVLNGSRPLTPRTAERMLQGLLVEPAQAQALLMSLRKNRKPSIREYSELESDAFHMISDWHYFAILSSLETRHPPRTAQELSERFGIPPAVAQRALVRLVRMGLIERRGRALVPTGRRLSTTIDVPSVAIRKAHLQGTELAQRSLLRDPVEHRDFSASTLALDPAKIPEAKRRLQAFRRRLAAFLESGERHAVYRLNLQLFPLEQDKGK